MARNLVTFSKPGHKGRQTFEQTPLISNKVCVVMIRVDMMIYFKPLRNSYRYIPRLGVC